MKKSTRTTTAIILLFLSATKPINGQDTSDSCFSLNGSTTCPAFQNFYISVTGLQKTYPFLSNVTNISSFDNSMNTYVNSPDMYLSNLGCTNKASSQTTIPTYARYSLTFLCASLIQDSAYSLPCNYQNNLTPPPLCQSTCFDYTYSVNDITDNINTCPNQAEQAAQLNILNGTCQNWPGLSGTVNCIIGIANEPKYCGFSGLSGACSYCKQNSTDTCCASLSGCNSLSTGAIIGIIIGCLVFAGLAGGLFFYYRYRINGRRGGVGAGKIQYNGIMMGHPMKKHGNSVEGQFRNGDNTSFLGYESWASQRAFIQPGQPGQQSEEDVTLMNNTMSQPQTPLTPHIQSPLPTITTMSMNQQQPSVPLHAAQPMEEFYEVKHPYPPQMGDELGLHVGDIVCVAMNFDDGWALGFNFTTGLKGVFPIVCVARAPEELIEQLLLPSEPINGALVEDGTGITTTDQLQQICENIRRSMSVSSRHSTLPRSELTQHENIPRRTASIMRSASSYDYRESESPTSPTLHTPFFDVNRMTAGSGNMNDSNMYTSNRLLQPEPALSQESFEMHNNPNRASKLEEEQQQHH